MAQDGINNLSYKDCRTQVDFAHEYELMHLYSSFMPNKVCCIYQQQVSDEEGQKSQKMFYCFIPSPT